MADKLPTFEDTQPVLNQQKVSSGAEGYESFGKVLSSLASESADQAIKVESEQSQAMYIHSVSNIEQLKTSSQMRMLEHPDQAARISEDMETATDAVKQAAFVNPRDRAKLDSYVSSANDAVALQGTETSVKQTQLNAAFTHYASWPGQLKAYQDALISGNEKQINDLQDAMLATLKNLVQIRALTPEQAGSSIKSMQGVADIAADHHTMYGQEDVSAQDYHTLKSSVLPTNSTNNVNSPINENTGWLVNYHSQDRSFQGVLSDISGHKLPDPQAFDSLEPAQRQHALLMYQGVRRADGMINSGASMPELEAAYKGLTRKGDILSYEEQGTRNYLGVYLDKLKNGQYLDAIGGTPAGGAMMQNFVSRDAALRSNGALDDNQKAQMLLQNKNQFVSNAISYGYGHHIDPNAIQPIPPNDVIALQQGFKLGNDPSQVLNVIGQYNEQNRPWLSKALVKPIQQAVVNTVMLGGNDVKPNDKLDYIAANQEGVEYSKVNIEAEKNNLSDPKLSGLIVANSAFKNALDVVNSQYDPFKSQIIQQKLVESALNYVKYQASKANDLGMTNRDEYIDKAAKMIASAYPKISGTNYVANPKQLNLTSPEMDVLAGYVVHNGESYLKEGVREDVFLSAIDRNKLKMTVSPTNEIMAIDGNNKVYWHAPFSPDLLAKAKHFYKQQEIEGEKSQKEMLERSRFGGLR
ncbi:hypothetical protein KW791_00085 [Candidatus Parcubacteria bacterium]|nr:hypothetical protein [Candidatus Parcubacteria bacterium]